MTRKSKIARLPRSIRDELNRRLDNGHTGIRLVVWLNSLPEVKEVLAREFQGYPITPQNLSQWKRGGYRDWLAQQEHAASLQDFLADAKELGAAATPEKLTEAIFTVVTVNYAAAMHDCWVDTPENRKRLEFWGRIVRDVVPLRHCEYTRQRLELDEQRMDLNRQRLELDRERLDLARQKTHAAMCTAAQATRPSHQATGSIEHRAAMNLEEVPALSPGLRRDAGRYPGDSSQEDLPNPEGVVSRSPQNLNTAAASPSALPGITQHATRNTAPPPGPSCRINPSEAHKTPLQINNLQPNPTKSNNPFFIFSQTTTMGQAARLSPSSSPSLAADEHLKAYHAQLPSAVTRNTEPHTLWLQFSNKGYNFPPRLAPSSPPQYPQSLSPEPCYHGNTDA